MIFNFKQKPIVVDFFTTSFSVFESSQPRFGSKKFPDWWKTLPIKRSMMDPKNMKTCPGFVNLHMKSIVLPMWTDCYLNISNNQSDFWQADMPDSSFSVEQHPSNQFNDYYPPDKFQHLKFVNPWFARSKSDARFLMHDAMWDRTSQADYFVASGSLQFNYQREINVNTFFMKGDADKYIEMKLGDPFVYLTPMTDKRVEIKCHLIEESESAKLKLTRVSYQNQIQKIERFSKLRNN